MFINTVMSLAEIGPIVLTFLVIDYCNNNAFVIYESGAGNNSSCRDDVSERNG